ncbi:condensation domain-containing protein [Actinosynnema sp. NPDC047251]|uniref:Non-ribosomal peptide synthetase n=1 Tax=Saccharothrix espanaensis (strain ATCC 51144 / DSM 44229 / JCM 9112 / NBRC 15066 / NRRL 15764) TaxID=1179773 RepID=K0K679_SACES|nr:condensation domain-containing protein [Saccharothrix espanaensis]CCH32399.1 Non-ribosomal peptide synthetase [Saccharothrix espanaensis DSM 44229]
MLARNDPHAERCLLYLDTRELPNEREAELRAALDQGYRLVVATPTPAAYRGYPLTHVIEAPVGDYDKAEEVIVEDLARHGLTVHGVVAWKDREVELAARLGARLGLHTTSPRAAVNVRNKVLTRRLLDGIEGANPRYAVVRQEDELAAAVAEVGVPCLLKPAGNSGGRGIRRVADAADAIAAYREFTGYNAAQAGEMFHYYEDAVLVEEELTGSEHSVAGVVSGGRVITLGVADKLFDRSLPLQYQNVVPSRLPAAVLAEALDLVRRAVAATGIDHCGFHVDLMVTDAGVRVLEVGGRLGGELINSHLIPLAQPGLNPYQAVLDVVQGHSPLALDDYTGRFRGFAASRVVMPPDFGVLDRIEGVQDVRRDSRCRDFMQLYGPGQRMVPPEVRFKGYEIGYLVAQCGPDEDIDATIAELVDRITITVVPDPPVESTVDDRPVHDLLRELGEHSVTVRAQDGNLRLDGPVTALPKEVVQRVKAHKPAILDLLARVSDRVERLDDPPVPGPLSPAQQAALAVEPDHGAARSVLRQSVRCAGEVDPEALAKAFARLLDRHEILRAVVADGRLALADSAPFEQAPFEQAGTPVDLRSGPAFALHVRPDGDDTLIELTAHPLVADARTLALALGELARLHNGEPEPADPVGYAEFTAAQARYLAHPVTAARRARLTVDPAVLRAPAASVQRLTAPAPTADVAAIAAELGSTVTILRLGAFLLAAHRLGLARAVAVEQPNRSGAFAEVLGPVATTALLPLPSAPTVREFLTAVRDRVLDAHEHQDLPLPAPADLVPRVRFTERPGPTPGPVFGGAAATLSPVEALLPGGDLALTHVDGVELVVEHDAAPERAEAVASLYRFLLDRLDDCLDRAPDDLPQDVAAVRRAEHELSRTSSAVEAVREIFADVLGRARVGPRENFFELGGTSLTVAKVVSRVRQRFGTAPGFAEVFDHPTPAGLAGVLGAPGTSTGYALVARPPLAELPASPQQVRYFLTYNIDPARSGRISVLVDEWADADAFRAAVANVVQRHELLRTGFFTDAAGVLHQRIAASVSPEVSEARLTAEDQDGRRAELEAALRTHTFDLAAPPLLKVLLDPLPQGGVRAAVGVFSGLLDAYSEGTLAVELRTAYEAALAGTLAGLPRPPVQYQDFCRWQHDLAAGPEFDRARTFWEQRYPADHEPFRLPADDGERTGAMRVFLLGDELSAAARDAAAACESSLFGFLLANFFERAAELYGRDDVSVGVLYHGRENEELADLVGYFVDLFCLRCDVRGPAEFRDLVRRVNQELFGSVDARAYQYQDLAERVGASPADPVFPVTGFHVNNVIVPGRATRVGEEFREQVLDLPYRPKFDFNIYVHESDRGILIRMAYATAVVGHERAATLAADFVAGVRRNVRAVLGSTT